MAEPPRRPVGLGIWPVELKLIENPGVNLQQCGRVSAYGSRGLRFEPWKDPWYFSTS